MDIFNGGKVGMKDFVYSFLLLITIAQSIFMWLYVHGVISLPFTLQRITLNADTAVLDEGNLYILPLDTKWMSQSSLRSSPAVVYEESVPLEYPNAQHQDIRKIGNGRYSVWDGYLYFSSSDNSDPRTNRRSYEIEWNYPVAPIFQWLSYLIGGLTIGYIIFISLKDNNYFRVLFGHTFVFSILPNKNALKSVLSPTRHLLYGSGLLLMIGIGYSFHPSDIFWYKLNIDKDQIVHEGSGEVGYIVRIGYKPFSANETKESKAVLFEDGKSLGPSNALLDRISRKGLGRYMFLDGNLYFSTSDNSDPRGNDRIYTLALPLHLPFMWHVSFYVAMIYTIAFGLVWHRKYES